jgi:nucleolar protein 12
MLELFGTSESEPHIFTLWANFKHVLRKTNLGKGFGYVQFKERLFVGLAVELDGSLIDGRKIRVTRCAGKKVEASATEGARGTRRKPKSQKRRRVAPTKQSKQTK